MGLAQLALPQTIETGEGFSLNRHAPYEHRNGASAESVECVDREALRKDIQDHLAAIGLNGHRPDGALAKDTIKDIHRLHRKAAQERIRRALGDKKLERFLSEVANGDEVEPENIQPELVEVRSGTPSGDLFRFATLLWSIPVSQGYGRRLRYLVKDRTNGKLIGLFALGDPVFNLRTRDVWIGWNQADRRERLVNIMDAYVVGAVPPYSDLLGGKLVTSLIASKEVARAFEERYGNSPGKISKKRKGARLALVTVTSALGRSSMYNRLRLSTDKNKEADTSVLELKRLGTTVGIWPFSDHRRSVLAVASDLTGRPNIGTRTDTSLATAPTGVSEL